MSNNFYVGIIYHSKKIFKPEYKEKTVLYTENNINYIDLKNKLIYTTDTSQKDYVIKESLISTNPLEYKEDYIYLLTQYQENRINKKRKLTKGSKL